MTREQRGPEAGVRIGSSRAPISSPLDGIAVIAVTGIPLAYLSKLMAALTHYGTTPAPIYFGAGYVSQRTRWRLGFQVSVVTLALFVAVGLAWWRVLGWW